MADETHKEDGSFAADNPYRFGEGNQTGSTYSWQTVAKVCEHMSEGNSLLMSCQLAGVPRSTFYDWMASDIHGKRVSDMYARAREERADLIADETISIADSADAETDNPQLIKLRIDTRKWAAAKMAPKRYGERVHNEHSGPDGGAIQTQSSHTVDLSNLDDDALDQLERFVTGAAGVIAQSGSDTE